MDVSKTQQKYKHYTCLCVSVMGQRRFRISMGALMPSLEAGDASLMIPQMKKCTTSSDDSSKSFVTTSETSIVNQNTFMSVSNYKYTNDSNKAEYKQTVFKENNVFDQMSTSTIHNQCQFPYYRSSKSTGRFPDAVLVKDVGISCMLLNQDASTEHVPEAKTLIKQLKKEYNDLSNITSKITMYTKDILTHLRKKNQRKHQLLQHLMSSKHAIASQYIDNKGNLCLKLRLFTNAETQCTPQHIAKDFDSIFKDRYVMKKVHCKHSRTRITCKDQTTVYQKSIKSRNEKDIQTETHKKDVEINTKSSPSPSSSSIYNYLMMRKNTSNTEFNAVLTNLNDTDKHWNCKNCSNEKSHKEHLKMCDPVIFTNWKEISKSKHSKTEPSSVISDESQEMTSIKKATLQKLLLNNDMINSVPNTKLHNVNIRIIKQNKKHV